MTYQITTHVLDLVQGTPANNIPATLEILTRSDSWEIVGTGRTNDDGRINNLLGESDSISSGTYRLTFDVASYFDSQQSDSFYSSIPIIFKCGVLYLTPSESWTFKIYLFFAVQMALSAMTSLPICILFS